MNGDSQPVLVIHASSLNGNHAAKQDMMSLARVLARDLNAHNAPSLVFFDGRGVEVFRTEAYLKVFTHSQLLITWILALYFGTRRCAAGPGY
jgi:thioredoxin-related protein